MKMLLTADTVGGVWSYTQSLARGLTGAGASVTVMSLGPRPCVAQIRALHSVGATLLETDLPLEWLAGDAGEVLEAGEQIQNLAAREGYDSVHLHSPAYAAGGCLVPTISVHHSCVSTWWACVKDAPLPERFAWIHELIAQGLRRSTKVIAPSRAFAGLVRAVYGFSGDIDVVHNGVAPTRLRSQDAAPFAVFAGRAWDEGKNIRVLDEAARMCSVPVEIAGATSGPHGQSIELSNCRARGVLPEPELQALLASRPIFVSPALFEPFGLSVLEAARSGCALVLNDIPSFRELWAGACLFVDARDPASIASAINRLAHDQAARDELSREARLRSTAYSEDIMCERTLSLHRIASVERCAA